MKKRVLSLSILTGVCLIGSTLYLQMSEPMTSAVASSEIATVASITTPATVASITIPTTVVSTATSEAVTVTATVCNTIASKAVIASAAKIKKTIPKKAVTKYNVGGFVIYKGTADSKLFAEAKTYVEKVPTCVLNKISWQNYRMTLVADPGAGNGFVDICGLTLTNENKILIQARECKFRRAIIHEIFHAYDDCLGFISSKAEFKAIYNEEADDFVVHDYVTNYHFKANVMEYFAEACQEYVYHPNELKRNTPKTYKFVKDCIAKSKGIGCNPLN